MEITAIRKPSPEPYRKQQLDFFSFLFFLMRLAGGEGEEVEGGRSGGGGLEGQHTHKKTNPEGKCQQGRRLCNSNKQLKTIYRHSDPKSSRLEEERGRERKDHAFSLLFSASFKQQEVQQGGMKETTAPSSIRWQLSFFCGSAL